MFTVKCATSGSLELRWGEDMRTLWQVFILPGTILVWLGYLFPKSGQIAVSKRQFDNRGFLAPIYSIGTYIVGGLLLFGSTQSDQQQLAANSTPAQEESNKIKASEQQFIDHRIIVSTKRVSGDLMMAVTGPETGESGNYSLFVLECSSNRYAKAAESVGADYVGDLFDQPENLIYNLKDVNSSAPGTTEAGMLIKFVCP